MLTTNYTNNVGVHMSEFINMSGWRKSGKIEIEGFYNVTSHPDESHNEVSFR